LKSLKVKIQEKDNEDSEIVGHYFYPQKDGDENVKTFEIPEQILKNFKGQKLTIAVKESKMALWEKNMFKTELAFIHLVEKNEIIKPIKFEKVKFDVIVRIRQALSKKEFETKIEEKVILDKLLTPFDVFAGSMALPPVVEEKQSKPEPTVAKEMISIAKEVIAQNPLPVAKP
jgi:hypothetical protein